MISRLALWGILIALAACSPSLNWREVRTHDGALKALLPCAPDRASRQVDLAGQQLEISMQGCEAGGALFAVSAAELGDPKRAMLIQVQWQAHLLGNMRAVASTNTPFAIKGSGPGLAPVQVTARGTAPNGRPVTVQAVWIAKGTWLYHAAIYAEHISSDMSEPFFSNLELQ